MKRMASALAFSLLFLLLPQLAAALACGDLNTPNQIYTLSADVSSPGTCFNVLANNVTLDGTGYTITYSYSTTGYAVNNSGGYGNVTIKNVKIVQGNAGIADAHAIYASGMMDSKILNNSLNVSGIGIVLGSSNSNTISNNIVTSSDLGILLYPSSNSNTISNNVITGFDGIRLGSSNSNTISNNTVTVYSEGISLSSSSNSDTISNNVVTAGTRGISLFSSSNSNTISNNTVTSGHDGISLSSSNTNTISNNVVTNSAYFGISLDSSSTNTITNNIVTGVYYAHMGIALISSSNSNTIIGGSIRSTSVDQESYDYYFYAVGNTNNFTNTNFTAKRRIYFDDATSWFNYRNDSASGVWLKTNAAAAKIDRTLAMWSQSRMRWNDTGNVTANYIITGLFANSFYEVYTSNGVTTGSYAMSTNSSGGLYFTIVLQGNTEIDVRQNASVIGFNTTATPTASVAPTVAQAQDLTPLWIVVAVIVVAAIAYYLLRKRK